jgi:hypothetical protein
LILILAASSGSALVTAGCRDTVARTFADSENGATTSRSAWRSPRSGATGATGADPAFRVLAVAAVLATGTGVPLASALPPSNGTTASDRRDGAGLAVGRLAWAGFFRADVFPAGVFPAGVFPAVVFLAGVLAIGALPAGVPHAETSTAPAATPITASTLATTEPGRRRPGDLLGPRMIRRQSRRPVSASKCISPKICAWCHTHSERG